MIVAILLLVAPFVRAESHEEHHGLDETCPAPYPFLVSSANPTQVQLNYITDILGAINAWNTTNTSMITGIGYVSSPTPQWVLEAVFPFAVDESLVSLHSSNGDADKPCNATTGIASNYFKHCIMTVEYSAVESISWYLQVNGTVTDAIFNMENTPPETLLGRQRGFGRDKACYPVSGVMEAYTSIQTISEMPDILTRMALDHDYCQQDWDFPDSPSTAECTVDDTLDSDDT